VLFLRGVAATLACGLLLVGLGDWRVVASALHPRALMRAAGETLSVLCYIDGAARLPIADAIAILQTAPLILILAVAFSFVNVSEAARVALALVGFPAPSWLHSRIAGSHRPLCLPSRPHLLIAARDLVGVACRRAFPVMVVTFATNAMVMVVAGLMSLGLESWRPPADCTWPFSASPACSSRSTCRLLLAYRLGRTAAVAPFFYSFALWAVRGRRCRLCALPNALALARNRADRGQPASPLCSWISAAARRSRSRKRYDGVTPEHSGPTGTSPGFGRESARVALPNDAAMLEHVDASA